MQAVYRLTINFVIAFVCLKFYNKFEGEKNKETKHYFISMMYATFRFVTLGWLEPFRIITSFLFFVGILMMFKIRFNWILLKVIYLFTLTLWLVSFLISALIILPALLIGIEIPEIISLIVGIPSFIITFSIVYRLDKREKIDFYAYGNLLKHPTVRKMALTIGILILSLYSFLQVSVELDLTFDRETSFIILGTIVFVLLIIIILTILIIRHINVEKRKHDEIETENLRLLMENELLAQKNLAVAMKLKEVKQAQEELMHDFDHLTSDHHAYKYVVPVLLKMQGNLLDKMRLFSDYSHEEKLQEIKDYTDQIQLLSFEINNEFLNSDLNTKMDSLGIPLKWNKAVITGIEVLKDSAEKADIYFSFYNHATSWESLNLSIVKFVRLFTNIVDNALKETGKLLESKHKEVRIVFKESDEYFALEVTDHASEFQIPVLQKLGNRKNSINGTGDGYAEIFELLNEFKGTLILRERKLSELNYAKTITIIFDGYNERLIDSHYRQDQLMMELQDTEFQVMDLY